MILRAEAASDGLPSLPRAYALGNETRQDKDFPAALIIASGVSGKPRGEVQYLCVRWEDHLFLERIHGWTISNQLGYEFMVLSIACVITWATCIIHMLRCCRCDRVSSVDRLTAFYSPHIALVVLLKFLLSN